MNQKRVDGDLPPGWHREWSANPNPGSRWVVEIVRPEVRIVEGCNPEADVAKCKAQNGVELAWEIARDAETSQ